MLYYLRNLFHFRHSNTTDILAFVGTERNVNSAILPVKIWLIRAE